MILIAAIFSIDTAPDLIQKYYKNPFSVYFSCLFAVLQSKNQRCRCGYQLQLELGTPLFIWCATPARLLLFVGVEKFCWDSFWLRMQLVNLNRCRKLQDLPKEIGVSERINEYLRIYHGRGGGIHGRTQEGFCPPPTPEEEERP